MRKIAGIRFVSYIPPITRRHRDIYELLKMVKPGQIVELDYKKLGHRDAHNLFISIKKQIENQYLRGIVKMRKDKVYYQAK